MPQRDRATPVIDHVDVAGAWARFRVDETRKCLALLRELRNGDVSVALGSPRSAPVLATLWAVDDLAGRLHFSAAAGTPGLQALLALPEIWAAANLHSTKLQFGVHGLAVAESARAPGLGGDARIRLEAALPSHVYSLPRRQALRQRQGRHQAPRLRFRHPLAPATVLSLAALDISSQGCAMWKPASELPLAPGVQIGGVEVQLDGDSFFFTDLLVQHVTRASDDPDAGARVGCSWLNTPESGRETLQRWLQAGGAPTSLLTLRLD